MIILDYQDRRSIYEQVADKFRVLILNGAMPQSSQMPSVRQLAMELSVNPNTIQRAYMELEQEGLIYPVKGKGNFIADSSRIQEISRRNFLEEFTIIVQTGNSLGVEEEELIYMIRDCYKEGEND